MLRRIGEEPSLKETKKPMKEVSFPAPFKEGLEFSSPARGTWNIVHTGMLIPQSHQIFVCAQGCLRGVVLTAAEMNAMGRYSSVAIREENVLEGNMEEFMIDGITDVLKKLSYKPKAVLVFISCQHFFLAYDQDMVFRELRKRFPDISFTDCYMIPTLRKSGLTPDQKMRIQLYSLLSPKEKRKDKINLIGSNLPISKSCELFRIVKAAGANLQMINWCKTYEKYLDMAQASLNLYYEPLAKMAAEDLKQRLGQEAFYLPFVYQEDRIENAYEKLSQKLGIQKPDFKEEKASAKKALKEAYQVIGNTPIAVDYTFTFRILSFVRMLLEHGFFVREIFADMFLPEEKEDFLWIKEHYPEMVISPTSRPQMRFLVEKSEEKVLAIGQKAAYFTGTDYFVNVVESGGLYGFDGIFQIANQMKEAFCHKKDRKILIQRKGYGCESCI